MSLKILILFFYFLSSFSNECKTHKYRAYTNVLYIIQLLYYQRSSFLSLEVQISELWFKHSSHTLLLCHYVGTCTNNLRSTCPVWTLYIFDDYSTIRSEMSIFAQSCKQATIVELRLQTCIAVSSNMPFVCAYMHSRNLKSTGCIWSFYIHVLNGCSLI